MINRTYRSIGSSLDDELLKVGKDFRLRASFRSFCTVQSVSKNGFLFVFDLDSMGYKDKESGQTADFSNLSALAPQVGLEPTTP